MSSPEPHTTPVQGSSSPLDQFRLGFETVRDPALQSELEAIDAELRHRYDMTAAQAAAGVLDLLRLRFAAIHPDRLEYAASVPKVAILLAWFHHHPEAAHTLTPRTRHELGLMIKASSNERAAQFSRELGLRCIADVLINQGFYDVRHGGGLWMGKHYGQNDERIGDPIGDHAHAATVRQLLRFYLLLEQGRLVSPPASARMREIFAATEIPHEPDKFVFALAGRDRRVLRKSGCWEDWQHDTAVVMGPQHHYLLVALTHHPRGNDYLIHLARAIDTLLLRSTPIRGT